VRTVKLTPEQIVTKAIAIIGPGARRAEVEKVVRFGSGFVKRTEEFKATGYYGDVLTKPQKEAARKFAVALHQLETALKNPHLTWSLIYNFPMKEIDLARWLKRTRAAADTKLAPPRPSSAGKLVAVAAAAKLLRKYNVSLKVSRGGKFCRLAALLYNGDEKTDLFRQCRAYLKDTNRV
jgi:hypothetical protein